MEKIFLGCEKLPDISRWDTSHICNSSLSLLKPSYINTIFTFNNGFKKNIIGDNFMTFSNLIKKSEFNTNIIFLYNGKKIDPNCNEFLIDLGIFNGVNITCIFPRDN